MRIQSCSVTLCALSAKSREKSMSLEILNHTRLECWNKLLENRARSTIDFREYFMYYAVRFALIYFFTFKADKNNARPYFYLKKIR